MKERQAILAAWKDARDAGQEVVLATVVKVEGSTYRKPGARLLVLPDGQCVGSVSRGCIEDEVARQAWIEARKGTPRVVRFTTRSEEGEEECAKGADSDGTIHMLLERIGAGEDNSQLALLAACRAHRRPGVLATVIASADPSLAAVGDRVIVGPDATVSGNVADSNLKRTLAEGASTCLLHRRSETSFLGVSNELEVSFELVKPPTSLFVFGAGNDVMPVVRLAKELGWLVTVADARAECAKAERFPLADDIVVLSLDRPLAELSIPVGAACIVMTHSADQDRALLRALAPLPLAYLGVLGPRRRTDRLLSESGPMTFAVSSGLHSPAGLDLGTDTPEEVALALVAEIQATLSDRDGRRLRDRTHPRVRVAASAAE